MDVNLNVCQKCVLGAEKDNCTLGCVSTHTELDKGTALMPSESVSPYLPTLEVTEKL